MISNLVNIVEGGFRPYVDENIHHTIGTDGRNACHNYSFTGFDCNDVPTVGCAAEVIWLPVEYSSEIEKNVNAKGEEVVFYHRKRGRLSFNGICDEDGLSRLQQLSMADRVSVIQWGLDGNPVDIPGVGTSFNTFNWQIESSDATDAIFVTVSFAVEDSDGVPMDDIVTGCCGSTFDNVDYEPCDLPEPVTCTNFNLTILASGSLPAVTLNANVANIPAGDAATVTWFEISPSGIATEIGTGNSVLVANGGTYRATAVSLPTGCTDTDQFVVVADCAGLSLALQYLSGLLIATPSISSASATYVWKFTPSICPGDPAPVQVTLPDTGPVVEPTQSGEYICEYDLNTGDPLCATSQTLNVNDCAFVANPVITRVGNDLTVDVSMYCAGTTSVAWSVDSDDNGIFTPLPDTTETITVDSNGKYRATVTGIVAGNVECIKDADYCVFALCDANVTITNLGAALQANPINCDNPVYLWEQQLQPGPWEPLDYPGADPTAQVITPVFAGNYRVTLTCDGGCVATAEITWFNPNLTQGVNSQLFVATTDGEFEFTVTNFNLAVMTLEDDINFRYEVYRNGVRVTWMDQFDINTLGNHTNWTYDQALNMVRVKFDDALFIDDWLLIVDTQGN